jgi:hypothetical protein
MKPERSLMIRRIDARTLSDTEIFYGLSVGVRPALACLISCKK